MKLSKFTIITLPYKKFNRAGFTYEARNRVGDIVMQGIASCTAKAKPFPITIQEAMINEAAINQGYEFGFQANFVPS